MTAPCDFVALSLLPVWRWSDVREQLRSGRTPADILNQHCDAGCRVEHRRSSLALDALRIRARAESALARAAKLGLDSIALSDPEYPPMLGAIVDPPPVLWVRGKRAALSAPSVAIVGSRAGSDYALTIAEHLAADLAAEGVTVVSGLARGVDSAAHRGALSVGGATVAVLGCGVDVVYPPEHGAMADAIPCQGALVSEFVPGTPPCKRFFPQRNRIISGLVLAVVVVEAGDRSGSLITARAALEQGRDVLAVPGSILNRRNKGGHALLRDGAKIVESADDILEELGVQARSSLQPLPARHEATEEDRGARGEAAKAPMPSMSQRILACLVPGEPFDLDAVAGRSGLGAAELLPQLFELELRGLVRRAGGGQFVRIDRSC
jgi:DNA processing protein